MRLPAGSIERRLLDDHVHIRHQIKSHGSCIIDQGVMEGQCDFEQFQTETLDEVKGSFGIMRLLTLRAVIEHSAIHLFSFFLLVRENYIVSC